MEEQMNQDKLAVVVLASLFLFLIGGIAVYSYFTDLTAVEDKQVEERVVDSDESENDSQPEENSEEEGENRNIESGNDQLDKPETDEGSEVVGDFELEPR